MIDLGVADDSIFKFDLDEKGLFQCFIEKSVTQKEIKDTIESTDTKSCWTGFDEYIRQGGVRIRKQEARGAW